jgi:hypothetical protein
VNHAYRSLTPTWRLLAASQLIHASGLVVADAGCDHMISSAGISPTRTEGTARQLSTAPRGAPSGATDKEGTPTCPERRDRCTRRRRSAIRGRIIRMGGSLAVVFGIVLALLGVMLLSDYRNVGTQILEKTMPNSLKTGDPKKYRKALGTGYLVGGIVLAGVGVVVLGK